MFLVHYYRHIIIVKKNKECHVGVIKLTFEDYPEEVVRMDLSFYIYDFHKVQNALRYEVHQ
jgi:hypothetical protein